MVTYLSGVLVSVVDVVIIDIWWLVFNVFPRKESWMYLLAFYLTTKAITENSMFFVLLKLYLVKILLTSLRVNCKLFIWRYWHSWRHCFQLIDCSIWKLLPIYCFSILILVSLPIKAVLICYKNSFPRQIVKPSWVSCWFYKALCRFNVW